MLRSVKSLEGFAIGATDGAFGHVKNFYFDDQSWVIRYPGSKSRTVRTSTRTNPCRVSTRRAISAIMDIPTTGAAPVFGVEAIIQERI